MGSSRIIARIMLAFSLLCIANGATAATSTDRSFGIWRNPKNSVHIRVIQCGDRMCGKVIWANEKAQADAAKGSDTPLVGSTLFQGFTQEKPGIWRGKVYVPDIGKTFSGTISVIDSHHMEGRGCLLRNIGCKSQIWTKIRE